MNLNVDDLVNLPSGASFQVSEGNATGTVTKNEDNTLEFTANCDSLTLLIETLEKEVYRFQSENTVLKDRLSEQKTEVIKEPNGWQWFQIYGFRVLLIINIIITVWQRTNLMKWFKKLLKSK